MSLTQNGTSGHSRGDSTAATVGASSQWTHRWREMDSNFQYASTVRWHRATDLPLPPTVKRRSAGRPPPMARPRNAACSAAHQLSAFAIGQPIGNAERLRARDLAESWQSLLGAAHIRVSSKPELKERLLAFIGDINREPVESRGGIGSHRFGPAPVALLPRGMGECDR